MAHTLKLDDNGVAVVREDGAVIYVDDTDGKEVALNVDQMLTKISNLNSESATRRRQLNELKAKTQHLEGIEDIAEFVANAQASEARIAELEAASGGQSADIEAEKLRIKESFEAKLQAVQDKAVADLAEKDAVLAKKDASIYQMLVASEFGQSAFFAGEAPTTFLTPEMAEKIWGDRFKVEDNDGVLQIVGYDEGGNQILSRERPGEPADFGEALAAVIDKDPNKERYMRASPGGSGAEGNQNANAQQGDVGVLITSYNKALKAGDVNAMLSIKTQLKDAGHPNAVL